MTDDELRKYHSFFSELWKFFKAHTRAEDSDWEKLIKDADELCLQHRFKSDMAAVMCKGVMDEIEALWREGRG